MGLKIQLDLIIGEYLSKVDCCDSCMAHCFCITNALRTSREPQDYCKENIKKYLEHHEVTNRKQPNKTKI